MSSNKKNRTQSRIRDIVARVNWRDPATLFLALVVIAGLVIVNKMIPPGFLSSTTKNFQVTIEHQKKNIAFLDQARDTFATDTFWIDTIDFPGGNVLTHAKLGNYDYSRNFFMTLHGEIDVPQPAEFRFIVASDDGFRLSIDGQALSQHTNDRPMTETVTNVRLTAGRHKLELLYFQGFGQLGLQAWYETPACGRRLLGNPSDCLRFVEQQ